MYNTQPQFQNIVQSQRVVNDSLMDTVSEIRWNKDVFVTSSWDGYIRFYQAQLQPGFRANIQVDFKTAIDCQEPVLSVSWKQDMSMVFAALADNTIRAYDVKTQSNVIIGIHDDCPARQVFWNEDLKLIISLGLDKKLRFWNLQTSGGGKPQHAFQIDLQHVPTVGEQSGNEQFFAYADVDNKFRWLHWSALRGNQNSVASRSFFNMEDNYLVGQISCVAINDNASQLAYATVDGRALVKSINSRGDLASKLQFKCYKVDEEVKVSQYRTEKVSRMYMCNAFQFNCRSQNWAGTCGSDGTLAFWDTNKKNKILGVKLDGPAVAGQVSQDGQIFAYATGYDWGQGLDKVGEFTNRVGAAYIEEKFLQYVIIINYLNFLLFKRLIIIVTQFYCTFTLMIINILQFNIFLRVILLSQTLVSVNISFYQYILEQNSIDINKTSIKQISQNINDYSLRKQLYIELLYSKDKSFFYFYQRQDYYYDKQSKSSQIHFGKVVIYREEND